MRPHSGPFLSFLAYYIGGPSDQFLRIEYGGPLRSVSSLIMEASLGLFFCILYGDPVISVSLHAISVSSQNISGPLDQFLLLLYVAQLRLVSSLTIRGPLRSVSVHTFWGPSQISVFSYYMGPLRSFLWHTIWGPLRSVSSLTILAPPPRSVSSLTVWCPLNFFFILYALNYLLGAHIFFLFSGGVGKCPFLPPPPPAAAPMLT